MKNLERLKQLAADVPRLAAKLRADDARCLALGETLRRNLCEAAGWGHNPNDELADLHAEFLRSKISAGPIALQWAERAAALEELKATAAQLQGARTELAALLGQMGQERDEELLAGYGKLTAKIAKLVRPFNETDESAERIARNCDRPQRLHRRLGLWHVVGDPVIDAQNFLHDFKQPGATAA